MPALSAVLFIYSFQSRPAFLPCRLAMRHNGVVGLPKIGHRTLPKISVGFLYGAYGPGNDFELILTVKWKLDIPLGGLLGSEFPVICNHCGLMAA